MGLVNWVKGWFRRAECDDCPFEDQQADCVDNAAMESIANGQRAIIERLDLIARRIAEQPQRVRVHSAGIEKCTEELSKILAVLRTEPFSAFQTWIDKIENRYKEQQRESKELQSNLLKRWESHAKALEDRIKALELELEART